MAHPFRVVIINALAEGGTRVEWDLEASFQDPLPYEFQLQVGSSGNQEADDWINVGASVEDSFFALDPTKRSFGKVSDVHYRVVLTAPTGVYLSAPTHISTWINHYQWRIAKNILRREKLRHRMFTSMDGYLLLRRRYGPICPECTDPYTKEITKTNCLECYGTGLDGGYFDAMPAQFADMGLRQTREHLDPARGTAKDISQTGRFLGYPRLRSYDVWINKYSDERYYLHSVAEGARVGNIPVVQLVEMRLIAFSDVVYKFPVPTALDEDDDDS